VKKGHDVKLAYFPFDAPPASGEPVFVDGVEIIPLRRNISPLALLKNTAILYKLIGWADVVHFQKCHHYAAVPVLLAGFMRAKPLHYDWDDWEEKIFYHSNKLTFSIAVVGCFFSVVEKLIPQLVDTVSVASRRLRQLTMALGVPGTRVFMAPVGADLEQFNPDISGQEIKNKYSKGAPLVLYLGQLHGGQYAELLIKAAKLVLEQSLEANFMIIGGGSRLKELRSLAAALGIENNIIFTDTVAHELIPRYIAASSICVACFEENEITRCKSPLKIAEYLASGKAIIASNVGEVRNMVGGAGLLVEAGNSGALAEGIIKVLKDDALRSEMGRRARHRAVRKYNWAKTADTLVEAYTTALCLHNTPPKEILIPAGNFQRGNLNKTGRDFGGNVVIDGGLTPSFAEYDIYFPGGGRYELWIKYASQIHRPCRIYINNKLICPEGCLETTAGWTINDARWFKQCELDIGAGFNTLKLSSEGIFSHLACIKFEEIKSLSCSMPLSL
jgi:glycosyltransferase involved in cell wall biosynthesis